MTARYGELVVTDANGKRVPAILTVKSGYILIVASDADATYPLTVDPLVWIEQKVASNSGSLDDWFRSSVAISGTTAVIGSARTTVNGNYLQGAAYVFNKVGGSWNQTAKLTASDGQQYDYFGSAVALSGTTVLVGAPYASIDGNGQQGAVYVFTETDGTWSQTQKLVASDGASGDYFGISVSISGVTTLVGASQATVDDNEYEGAAYIFSQANGSWSQTFKLTASDGTAGDAFGTSVVLAGNTALIGAPDATANGHGDQGAVYVFNDSGGNWTQMQKLIENEGAGPDQFGTSVALDGTTALIGAPTANYAPGAAYVFSRSDGTWTQAAELTPSDGAEFDYFGTSVAVFDTTVLVGAYGATVNAQPYQGAAYLFHESNGTWTQIQKLTASDGGEEDEYGYSVALSNKTALIGALTATVNGNTDQGAAYFYDRSALGLALSAPDMVNQGQSYTGQTIVTNASSAASPAVAVTVTIPAAANFISASATQGSCNEDTGVVTCAFGQIAGNGGTATANVTLKAIGSVGNTIENTASVSKATPPLTASAPTTITGCPQSYTEYDGTLNANGIYGSPPYQAPAGLENAILGAPGGFALYAQYSNGGSQHLCRIPGNEIHRSGPAGTYRWGVKAGNNGGAYMLCIKHP